MAYRQRVVKKIFGKVSNKFSWIYDKSGIAFNKESFINQVSGSNISRQNSVEDNGPYSEASDLYESSVTSSHPNIWKSSSSDINTNFMQTANLDTDNQTVLDESSLAEVSESEKSQIEYFFSGIGTQVCLRAKMDSCDLI